MTLRSLSTNVAHSCQAAVRCENLKQALQYINKSKLQQYRHDKGSFEYLFELLIQNADILAR